MADEIDAGQKRGEVAKKNQTYAQDSGITKLSDIGVSSQRVSEYRKMRDGYWTRARSSLVLRFPNALYCSHICCSGWRPDGGVPDPYPNS